MRVRQRKLYKKIILLKYNVGVQAALYAKERGSIKIKKIAAPNNSHPQTSNCGDNGD